VSELADKHCGPCRGDVPPLDPQRVDELLSQVEGWRVVNEHHLEKSFQFDDFSSALEFVNAVGAVAEEESHHPDVHLAWGLVRLEIWTHSIDALTESDFILAAKCDRLYG
jgi:4a-hydroxytetrahydrobiopterin dehydratase